MELFYPPFDPPLCVAAEMVDVELVRSLLQSGDDVNQLGCDGMTALGIVVKALVSKQAEDESNLIILKELLEKGADIDAARYRSLTPLWLACGAGRADLIDQLLRHGCSSYAKPAADSLRRHVAFDSARQIMRVYVDRRSPALQCQPFLDTRTPLMEAAWGGHGDVVKMLISAGRADSVGEVDCRGFTALHFLVLFARRLGPDFLDIIGHLLDTYDDNRAINLTSDKGQSVLCAAVQCGIPSLCQMLIDRGANPNIGRSTYLPLITACRKDDLETADILLAAGADPNGQSVDMELSRYHDIGEFVCLQEFVPDTMSSLPICASLERDVVSGSTRVLTRTLFRLIEAGADVNRLDDAGWSPLHRAVECFKIATGIGNLQLFHDNDENDDDDEDAGVGDGFRLSVTVYDSEEGAWQWQRIIATLLSAGADPNRLSRCGETPLRHLATNISEARQMAQSSNLDLPPFDRFLPNVDTVFTALVQRRDGLGANLFEPADSSVQLHELLLYCDSATVSLLLRMLSVGVGHRTLAEFCRGAFCDRRRSPLVTVELCQAVVLLDCYRVSDEEIQKIRDLASRTGSSETGSAENVTTLQEFEAWLHTRKSTPPMLKHLCRTYVRKRLAVANGYVDMGQLVDRLLPDCYGLNDYMMGVDLLSECRLLVRNTL